VALCVFCAAVNLLNKKLSCACRCCCVSCTRRLYIICWRELSRRRLLPAVSPAAGQLTTPTVAGLPGLCEIFRPTTFKSSPILRLLSSHWATSVVRTKVVGVANVGDSLRRLCSLQHRIYSLLGRAVDRSVNSVSAETWRRAMWSCLWHCSCASSTSSTVRRRSRRLR